MQLKRNCVQNVISNLLVLLRHKDGQDRRGKILLEDPRYALTIPPGKNNARNYSQTDKIQLLGDWHSDAYKRYLAFSLQDKIQVSKTLREYIVQKPSVKFCDT